MDHGPALLEPFLNQICIYVRGWGLLLRGLRFGDRGPLMLGIGAGEGIRTLDPNLGKVVLYH